MASVADGVRIALSSDAGFVDGRLTADEDFVSGEPRPYVRFYDVLEAIGASEAGEVATGYA